MTIRIGDALDNLVRLGDFWNRGLPEDESETKQLARERVSTALELTKDFGKIGGQMNIKGAIPLITEALNAVGKEAVIKLMDDLGATDAQKRLFNEGFLHLMTVDSMFQTLGDMHTEAPDLARLQWGILMLPRSDFAEFEELIASGEPTVST